jgi:Na+-translocating ferredoxin:NAD+ oxidoreductase subunit B
VPASAAEPTAASTAPALAARLDAALPQTQCTRCGYPDCRGYAEAIAAGDAEINRCPPGGAEGIARLAALTGRAPLPLDAGCGREGPRLLAVIDEAGCIGCTLCIKACPVDCIVGAPKAMHTVIDAACTGCELCLPACPVDCIALVPVTPGRSGWAAWSTADAATARERYAFHRQRVLREQAEHDERLTARTALERAHTAAAGPVDAAPAPLASKSDAVAAAMQRAREQRLAGR